MINPLSDEEIVENIRLGETDRFRDIVIRYQKKIFALGMRFFRNEEDSLDYTQDVLLRTFESLQTFKGLSPFRYWIMKIAVNMGINRVKSFRHDDEQLADEPTSPYNRPDSEHEHNEIRKLIDGAMQELPPNYRVCLELYFYNGMSYHEISHITGIPVNTIKSNAFRAKLILRNHLKGTIAEDYDEL